MNTAKGKKKEPERTACWICGKIIERDRAGSILFCGSFNCLARFANEYECPYCGRSWRDMRKGAIALGKLTEEHHQCPDHSKWNYKRYTYTDRIEMCPVCKEAVVGDIGLAFLGSEGKCLRCDETQADAEAERKNVQEGE